MGLSGKENLESHSKWVGNGFNNNDDDIDCEEKDDETEDAHNNPTVLVTYQFTHFQMFFRIKHKQDAGKEEENYKSTMVILKHL